MIGAKVEKLQLVAGKNKILRKTNDEEEAPMCSCHKAKKACINKMKKPHYVDDPE